MPQWAECAFNLRSAGQQRLTYDSGHRGNVFQARAFPATGLAVVVTCAADGQVIGRNLPPLSRRPAGMTSAASPPAARRAAHRGRPFEL